VRCIKPNGLQVAATFDAPLTLHQLRCCGVLEVTRIARAGYPTRYLHRNFAERYHVLLHGAGEGGSLQAAVNITQDSQASRCAVTPVL
jgi:myosin V